MADPENADTLPPGALQFDLQQILPEISDAVSAAIRKRAEESISYTVQEAIRKAVAEYVEAHIIPEVQQMLADRHGEMLAQIGAGVVAATNAVAESLKQRVAQRLAGHEGDKMIRNLLHAMAPAY